MNLKDQISEDIKTALKQKEETQLQALRLLYAEIKNSEIKKKPDPLKDSDIIALIKRQVKQYKEVVQELVQAGRSKKAEEELTKLEHLKKYLPPELTSEELVQMVNESITNTKAEGLKDQGIVIKEVQKKVQGRADNVQIAQMVREKLQQL